MADERTPGLDQLQHALDAGDIDAARRALLTLPPRERELLAEEIGPAALERTRSAAARGRRRGKLGQGRRAARDHGLRARLVSDGGGDADRIWLNYLRLIGGRIDDLELDARRAAREAGRPASAPPGYTARRTSPLLLELDTRWHVQPFAFDWREDIDRSADRLAGEIAGIRRGRPRPPRRPLDGRARVAPVRAAASATCGSRWTTRADRVAAAGWSCSGRRTGARSRSRSR